MAAHCFRLRFIGDLLELESVAGAMMAAAFCPHWLRRHSRRNSCIGPEICLTTRRQLRTFPTETLFIQGSLRFCPHTFGFTPDHRNQRGNRRIVCTSTRRLQKREHRSAVPHLHCVTCLDHGTQTEPHLKRIIRGSAPYAFVLPVFVSSQNPRTCRSPPWQTVWSVTPCGRRPGGPVRR